MISSWPQLLVHILLAGRPGSCVRMGHAFGGCAGDLPGNIVGFFFAGAHRAHCFFWAGNVDIDTFYVMRPVGDGAQPQKEGHAATQLSCYVIEEVYVIICAGLCGGTMP